MAPDALNSRRHRVAAAILDAAPLHALFFLTGMGTLLLGPMLPSLTAQWGLHDERNGLLIGTQFLGGFLGAISLRRDLRRSLAEGCVGTVAGFGCAAVAAHSRAGFIAGEAAFLLAGFGLGRSITAVNLIAGASFRQRRGSALALLNLTWGLGAVAAPVAVGLVVPVFRAPGMLAGFALPMGLASWAVLRHMQRLQRQDADAAPGDSVLSGQMSAAGLVYFAALFFLYGGLENSISGWLSTLTVRSAGGTFRGGALATTALWAGLTGGRAAAALILLRVSNRALMQAGLVLASLCTMVLLRFGSGGASLSLIAVAIGLGLAPAFPAMCATLIGRGPRARDAGTIMAISGLGGAFFPWLVGWISQRSGSLQRGLLVPVALTVVLLALVLLVRPSQLAD